MIPLTISAAEMRLARSWVIAAAEEMNVTDAADRDDDRDTLAVARRLMAHVSDSSASVPMT
ncbi:MAG: hypothetical protein R2735_05055 [Microthrixaceae bacterium]